MTERYSPPSAEEKLLPLVPLPAVWRKAVTIVSSSPLSRFKYSLVLSHSESSIILIIALEAVQRGFCGVVGKAL